MEEIFSKTLQKSDVKERCSIPTKCLKKLPRFEGKHSLVLPVRTRDASVLSFRCVVRKKGRYAKPVLSGDWRQFAASQGLKYGDEIKFLKDVEADDDGEYYYRVEVKRAIVALFGKALCYAQPYIM